MSCTVTETLNGEWELTLVHDIDECGKWTRLSEGCILRAPVPAAMTPRVDLVTQQYQTSTYNVEWAAASAFRFGHELPHLGQVQKGSRGYRTQ